MKEQLQRRLQSLKTEYTDGQKVLADLETKQASVRDTLLRISGAIQVLEEELSQENSQHNGATIDTDASNVEVIPMSEIV
jgi:chromosome segregation ATPase